MKTVLVAAAVIIQEGVPRRVFISQRRTIDHLGGYWEFPGGKVEENEDPKETIRRELREELGLEVTAIEPIEITFHRYEQKAVLLLFYRTELHRNSPPPQKLEVHDWRWATREELECFSFPPADLDVLEKVKKLLQHLNNENTEKNESTET